MKKRFETTSCGKWILVGEHAVLRGSTALVFPLFSAQLKFRFEPREGSEIDLQLAGSAGNELEVLFWGVLEKACGLMGRRRSEIGGVVSLTNEIRVGAGLGASAAFCVAMARWFASQEYIGVDQIEDFARELENVFHGESSGVDVAVVHAERPLKFQRGQQKEFFVPRWTPGCYLTYSGQRGVTRECVDLVKELVLREPVRGAQLDAQMKEAAVMAEKALSSDHKEGFPILKAAMELAALSFSGWGLLSGLPEKKAAELRARGASQVKPTGSGGGGYLLSLWDQVPQDRRELMSCFSSAFSPPTLP
ncbi:MAG: hypothetical protein C5B49_11470 [Bdellovibrio sp.]|nr:MAG: hypothetical protein C5B49_11470 [Bdellovibrio sp.]